MAVRNFWMEANIDGRKTVLSGGPQRKDGGLDITVYQRNDGCIDKAVRIYCVAEGNKLVTRVFVHGELAGEFETER